MFYIKCINVEDIKLYEADMYNTNVLAAAVLLPDCF